MIPGFVTAYKDNKNYIHLYFYPGLDDLGRPIYRDIDLKNLKVKYERKKNSDNSVDFKFFNNNIIRLNCKLLVNLTEEEIFETIDL